VLPDDLPDAVEGVRTVNKKKLATALAPERFAAVHIQEAKVGTTS
jgi:hypothetical protein